jgi:hypothetical protein
MTATTCAVAIAFGNAGIAEASDHFDSPNMMANPQADVADIYAWTAPDGRRLNLVMTVVGHSLSDRLHYDFHIDSGRAFGRTTASTTIVCRFPSPGTADCSIAGVDRARGDASKPQGLVARNRRFRVFEGLRDDPFYNNIKGPLTVYQTAATAVTNGAPVDVAGCARLTPATVQTISQQWSRADGSGPENFLANWTASAIVISIDLSAVNKGGPILAVWGTSASTARQLDRMGRPFVGNTLLGVSPFSTDAASGTERDNFNKTSRAEAAAFVPRIEHSLAIHDSLDGKCGNQVLADRSADPSTRYRALARIFADDRLWVNSASRVCTQFFAVELASEAGRKDYAADCGGRTPIYGTPNVWRSLLVAGNNDGVDDGLHHDEHEHSATIFPFLAPPGPHGIDH